VLYLQGKRDRVVPRLNFKRIVAIREDVQSIVVDSSHMALQTRPQEATRIITNFIEQFPVKTGRSRYFVFRNPIVGLAPAGIAFAVILRNCTE
jgi:hypothetical protein